MKDLPNMLRYVSGELHYLAILIEDGKDLNQQAWSSQTIAVYMLMVGMRTQTFTINNEVLTAPKE